MNNLHSLKARMKGMQNSVSRFDITGDGTGVLTGPGTQRFAGDGVIDSPTGGVPNPTGADQSNRPVCEVDTTSSCSPSIQMDYPAQQL